MPRRLYWQLTLAAGLLASVCLSALGESPRPLDKAVDSGLERIRAGAVNYTRHRDCFSCHHQALPIMALTDARRTGRKIDQDVIDKQIAFTVKSFKKYADELPEGKGIGGGSHTVGYGLATLHAAEYPADDLTLAMVQYLLKRQRDDGSWAVSAHRPPAEASSITTTAFAVRGLKAYAPPSGDKEREKLRAEAAAALEKGRKWLVDAAPQDTEEHVFRLLGLLWSDAKKETIVAAADALRKLQRADGGWGQLPEMDSDAYATGSALVALCQAGLTADDPAIKKGVGYLLKTQDATGAWIVETRSRPFQTYFDNGDPPGNKHQFISFTATSWAVRALLAAQLQK